MGFVSKVARIVANSPVSIYIGWYEDQDPEFGQKLDAAKTYAALWKLKGVPADLAKAAQHVEKEHNGKGIVLSFPVNMSVVEAKKQVLKAVHALIAKQVKPAQQPKVES